MFLIVTKLLETFSRAAFVLLVTFSLPLAQAGQFGLTVTLLGLAAFAVNFESHVDLQRSTASQPAAARDERVMRLQSFFVLNYAVVIPLLWASLLIIAHADFWLTTLATVILLADHMANQTYQLALVDRRYTPLVAAVAGKNSVLLALVAGHSAFRPGEELSYVVVTEIWAMVSALSCLVLPALWFLTVDCRSERMVLAYVPDFRQYKRSLTHFLIGLLAILSLQFDRLVVGGLLPFDETGRYYRHVLLVSLLYQITNIAFHNRVTGGVFRDAPSCPTQEVVGRLHQEWRRILVLALVGVAAALALDSALSHRISNRFALDVWLGCALLAVVLLRVWADFNALYLNGRYKERRVLRAQLVAFTIASIAMVTLAAGTGVFGVVLAAGLGAVVYVALTELELKSERKAATV